jgi:hypothetical protein
VSTDLEERFWIDLRPEAAYVGPARIFGAELARQSGVSEEILDDVKVAVGEALSRALNTKALELRVKAVLRDGRLFFEIPQGDGLESSDSSTDRLMAALSLELITVLFEDGEAATSEEGDPVIRFSVPISSRA